MVVEADLAAFALKVKAAEFQSPIGEVVVEARHDMHNLNIDGLFQSPIGEVVVEAVDLLKHASEIPNVSIPYRGSGR